MSKVLVDRELLEYLAEMGDEAIQRMGSYLAEKHGEQRYVDAARAILAQPVEAEGVEFPIARFLDHKRDGAEWMVRAADHDAALSALTAERDNYKSWYDDAMDASNIAGFAGISAAQVIDYQDKEIMQLRAEVEALRKDAERYRWLRLRIAVSQLSVLGAECSNTVEGVDAGIDTAMAAKEA